MAAAPDDPLADREPAARQPAEPEDGDARSDEARSDAAGSDEALAAEWAAATDEAAAGDDEATGDDAATDEDGALAAEWEAAAGEDETGRALDQDEIDSLLGFDNDGPGGDDQGVQAIINSALVNYERLPMLEVVYDRLVRMMTTSLRNFTGDNVEVSIDSIQSIRFGDYLNSIPLPAMLGVFKAEEWDNYGLMTVDSALIYSIVDVLLGGRRGTAAMRIEGRPYTTIERSLVERMVKVVLTDFSAAFAPLSPVRFSFDRLETNPRFATIARPANAGIVTHLRIDMEDRGGKLELMLPYATLEPVRELLLQMFMGEKFGRDSIWEHHLASELWGTDVDLTAVLDEQVLMLGQIMQLEVGTPLLLNAPPDGSVSLHCGDVSMFRGKLGRKNGNIAVRVTDRLRSAE